MIAVKLYGHPTSTYEYIKMKLQRFAREEGIEMDLLEVNDLEAFVEDEVDSIPSIRINDAIKMSFKRGEEVEIFVNTLKEVMKKEANSSNKKRILVPTDFSPSSANALEYAFFLGKSLHADIDVMHAYNPTGATAEGVLYFDAELEGIRRDQLKNFCQTGYDKWKADNKYPLKVNNDFRIGFVVPATKDIVDDSENFFIVIGSTGGSASFKKFFGSVTTELAAKVNCPIFIIPENVKFKQPTKIAYACDSSSIDVEAVQDVLDLVGCFEPELHLIHIAEKGESYPNYDVERAVNAQYPKTKVFFHLKYSNDVVDELNKFIEENDVDMVAVSKEKRGFLNSLFHKSVTRAMSIKSHVPLLVIHK